jgi:hypothetical protein
MTAENTFYQLTPRGRRIAHQIIRNMTMGPSGAEDA